MRELGPWLVIGAILVVPALLLASPPAVRRGSWSYFGLAFIQSLGGIVIPLLTFLGAASFTPDWKGGCRFGWLDCFHGGKFALLPLVLWAVASFYAAMIWRNGRPARPWVKLGLLQGVVVGWVCLVHGFATIRFEAAMLLGMLIPLYTAAWYGVAAYLVVVKSSPPITPSQAWMALGTGAPWWVLSAVASWWSYRGLPEQPPSCFVVTAALRGHPALVGPLAVLPGRDGRLRRVNRQLLAFWALEDVWARSAPQSHRAFRRCYNRLGPRVARRMNTPWRADAVYLALKPLEWGAMLAAGQCQEFYERYENVLRCHTPSQ